MPRFPGERRFTALFLFAIIGGITMSSDFIARIMGMLVLAVSGV
jgi:hypothetical protein